MQEYLLLVTQAYNKFLTNPHTHTAHPHTNTRDKSQGQNPKIKTRQTSSYLQVSATFSLGSILLAFFL